MHRTTHRGSTRRCGAALLVLSLLLAISIAGCTAPPPDPVLPTDEGAATSEADEADPSEAGSPQENAEGNAKNESTPEPEPETEPETETPGPTGPEPAPTEGENETTPEPEPQWPPLATATVRPGIRIHIHNLTCTTGFLFRDADNSTLYLSTAAHCMRTLTPGDTLTLGTGNVTARLAYSGWWDGTRHDPRHGDDFALLAIDEAHRTLVHPAILHWGGPTALAQPTNGSAMLDAHLVWHNGLAAADEDIIGAREGYLCIANSTSLWIRSAVPVLPGETGSGVLFGDGQAAAIIAERGALCGTRALWLAPALEQAQARGVDATLVTWTLLNEPVLPEIP